MVPLAPDRLSTTTCCPKRSPRRCATIRATTSLAVPGGKGATKRIGRTGNGVSAACDDAYPWLPRQPRTPSSMNKDRFVTRHPSVVVFSGQCAIETEQQLFEVAQRIEA